MPANKTGLSSGQAQFLTVVRILGSPLSVEVAGALSPLSPGPLLDLIDKGEKEQWLLKDDAHRFVLMDKLPPGLEAEIGKYITPETLNRMIEQLYALGLTDKITAVQMLRLLSQAGRSVEAAEYEVHLAHDAFRCNDRQAAHIYLRSAVQRLYPLCPARNVDRLYAESVLALSNICFSLGYGLGEMERFLVRASDVAEGLGDRRSRAMINLHLGRLYYFTARRDEALTALSMGFEEIQALGDDDIAGRSAVFLGLLYFIKGLHREAVGFFEKAEQAHANAPLGVMTHPMAPYLTGYCACYLGQFHQAIGNLDFHWRKARDRADAALAATIRAALGTVLVFVGKQQEGLAHLGQTIEQAHVHNSALGVYFAYGGLALHHFLAGRLEEAYRINKKIIQIGDKAGIIRQYASPWVMELHYEYHRLGFEPLPGINFEEEMIQVLNGINIHLQGVVLRLRARERWTNGEDKKEVAADLCASRRCLEQAGDPVQTSKSIFEMVRLKMSDGNRTEASRLAREALRLLGGYAEEFFPDEFRPLIDDHEGASSSESQQTEHLQRYLEMIESLYPIESRQEILTKVLMQTNRLFGAERSALFWFPEGQPISRPELLAACHLSAAEVASNAFKPNMKVVLKAFQSNLHQLSKPASHQRTDLYPHVQSVMCLPVEMNGAVRGVMYFDNSYLPDAFEFLDPEIMRRVIRHTNMVVERRFNHLRVEQERKRLASIQTDQTAESEQRIIARSREMKDLIRQADHVADTPSTILILGDTGTGKELLARRIHNKSRRSRQPFITVDAATIPEQLLESELFGHERGAFTGADRRKIGRLELAHGGTLFLDEIGELPLAAQAKLLRALQERCFNRVGGTKVIHSNFRLVAATNRDLEMEVANGRFREDLYYRVNVIPIKLPPLRERSEDIVILAEHFLARYGAKYQRRNLALTARQKENLARYAWPGNVRELKNIIERAVLLSTGDQLSLDLPDVLPGATSHPFADLPTLEDLQRRYIAYVVQKTAGRIGGPAGAAEILGMNRTSLYSRLRQLKMNPNDLRAKRT